MLHELDKHRFQTVIPVFHAYFQDPMLYSVLEGHRNGRVFVNDTVRPTCAFVWTDSESAYLAGGGSVPESL